MCRLRAPVPVASLLITQSSQKPAPIRSADWINRLVPHPWAHICQLCSCLSTSHAENAAWLFSYEHASRSINCLADFSLLIRKSEGPVRKIQHGMIIILNQRPCAAMMNVSIVIYPRHDISPRQGRTKTLPKSPAWTPVSEFDVFQTEFDRALEDLGIANAHPRTVAFDFPSHSTPSTRPFEGSR